MRVRPRFVLSHRESGTGRRLIVQDNDPEAFSKEYDSAKERHLKALLKKVNFDALRPRASSLHGSVNCYIPAASLYDPSKLEEPVPKAITNQTGGHNCNLDIKFDDGVIWIARLRLDDPILLPHATQKSISMSEVATLQYLADKTCIRVPKVFHHCFDGSEIGVPYMLMKKLSGKPLDWSEASSQQRTKVSLFKSITMVVMTCPLTNASLRRCFNAVVEKTWQR
jgi:hypothetical protein